MTEKRFTFNKDTVATNLKTPITYNNKTMSIGEVLEKLNEFAEENEQLRKDATTLIYANQDYRHENEQLKKRNNNQYNQLTELWQIIEEENWEKLIAMKKQLKEDEERLQKEWVCYE